MASVDDIMKKYGAKIEHQINTEKTNENFSREFLQFKKDMLPELTRYESWCNTLGNIVTIKLSKKDQEKVQRQIDISHLNVTPSQALTLAVMALLLTFFTGILISAAVYFITGGISLLFIFLVLITSLFLFYYLYMTPFRLANSWRLKASSQMVPCILYIVAYMKHTSNLERAVSFAAQHLQAPLALDFRKIFWDLETGKYSTVKESLDAYLETWRDYSMEFIEAFHLIESSLYEPSEDRRIAVLEKSLQVILDGVYEKMLKYTHDVRSPLTNLYMLGIVLPTLGLALLPLASTLLGGMIQWYHVFVIFDLIIPFFVFYLTSEVMMKRPGGYGETEILEMNPLYGQYKSRRPYLIAFLICLPLLIIGFLPFIFQIPGLTYNINLNQSQSSLFGLKSDYTFSEIGLGFFGENKIFDFKPKGNGIIGPFGLIAVILSLCIPLAIALFFVISYRLKTKELIKTREASKQLEREFASSLFQLGNRLGDGMPAEIAFARISESTRGLVTENFFKTVNTNIQQMGMSLEQAIFNPRRGAIIYYPSALISISMKILVESVKKGLQVAARSLMSISEYIKNVQKINERLRDLLAEVVSDMKSNMTFLAPLLAGVVVGLGVMITMILSKLQIMMSGIGGAEELGSMTTISQVMKIFDLSSMIPPYYLQVAVGIYIIEVIFILTSTLVTVDSGEDKLKKKYDTGNNLLIGILLYLTTALISIIALSLLAILALGGMNF